MSRHVTRFWAWFFVATVALSGCHPRQPIFLHEDGDLSHLLEESTDIEVTDEDFEPLDESACAFEPRSITNPKFDAIWDLSLEEAVAMSLQNSKVMRTFGAQARQLGQLTTSPPDRLVRSIASIPTIYDPAIADTDPTSGVHAALSAFDAQFSADLSWAKTDRPRNVRPFAGLIANVTQQDLGRGLFEISKLSAAGTQFAVRSDTVYTQSTQNFGLPSDWYQGFEVEATQPLLRGAGTQVNRANVLIARMNTDISLAQLEAGVRDHVSEVERAYWELYFFYRALETAKVGRDSALITWKKVYALYEIGAPGGEAEKEAQSREQYFFFRSAVEEALRDLYRSENRLRFMMGLAATDSRLIRPHDEPSVARVRFEWQDILCESLVRSPELRGQQWQIKQLELGMIQARNQLLPQVDLTATYRWLGVGDDLIDANRRGANFPAEKSMAFDELTEGRYQEYGFGLRGEIPIGFRRELARVRNQQLRIARARAQLEDLELEVSHQLTDAVQNLDGYFVLTQTNFNRHVAADRQVDAVAAAYETGTVTLDLLLEAQRRRAEAEISYYQSLVEYNLAVMQVHLRKGSLLEYDGIVLSEGPWPCKAYFDAHTRARRRDASYYLNYGFTRPGVISRGPVEDNVPTHVVEAPPAHVPQDDGGSVRRIESGDPTPADPAQKPEEDLTPGPVTSVDSQGPEMNVAQADVQSRTDTLPPPPTVEQVARKATGSFEWGELKLKSAKAGTGGVERETKLRQVSHEEDWKPSTTHERVKNPPSAQTTGSVARR